MSQENYIKELETRVERQRHRIITLEYDLDNLRSQTSVFARNTLKIFQLLGFKEEHVIQMYKDIVNGLGDSNLPS